MNWALSRSGNLVIIDYMTQSDADIQAWFSGRLPAEWVGETPEVRIDREEITIVVRLSPVELGADASDEERREAAAGRISGWREDTRDARIDIAREAEHRFERKVSWGAAIGETSALFTHLAVPVMTRLRQPQREVLDTLVAAGVAQVAGRRSPVVRPPGRSTHRRLVE